VLSARAVAVVVVFLLLLSLAVYGNSLRNPFQIDDPTVIENDIRVRQCRIGELLTGNYRLPPYQDLLYRPLVNVSFALNWALSHEAWTFRLPNVVLHAATALVVFLLAWELFRERLGPRATWAGLVASVVFVVHPIHTECLNSIVGRADVAAALFGLLAVWLHRRDAVDPRGWLRPALAATAFATAIFFKESALPVVGVTVLLDAVHPALWRWRRLWRCYVPLVAVVAGYLSLRAFAIGGVVREAAQINVADNVIANPTYGLGPGDSAFLARWGTPLATFGKGVGILVWPHPLCWDYSYAAIDTVRRLSDPRLLFGVACAVAVAVAMVVSLRRRRVVFISLGIAILTYAIVSNTVVLIGTVFAERLWYLPSAGFCLFVGALAAQLLGVRRPASWVGLTILAAGTVACAWLTVDRNRDWQSRERLDATDAATNPRSCRLLSSMAADAIDRQDFDAAMDYARKSIEIYPGQAGAWKSLGIIHWHRRSAADALLCFKKCFELGGAGDESAMVTATDVMVSVGDYAQAIRLLEQFVAGHPLAATARNNLAWYLLKAEPVEFRNPDAALRYAAEALSLRPDLGGILDTYVEALLALGRPEDARAALGRLLPAIPADDPHRAELENRARKLQQ
jgi:Tfp pilus assembly protein PilF